jgi:glycosyltransferase involved in cell wall biosynthesis
MEISFDTHAGGLDAGQGYGVAGEQIVLALQRLGHTTPFQNPAAPIGLAFTQPYYFKFHENQYKIGYTPWESTEPHDGWVDSINQMDEFWTTSDWCLNVFKNAGVKVPMHVFEHGISSDWAPYRRKPGGVLKFLHHGEPATRKCGQMTLDAFSDLFGNDDRYSLTIKSNGPPTARAKLPDGSIIGAPDRYSNVRINKTALDIQDLVSLYYSHDVLIYPSFGEGFGFIPLQALATGMPVIFNTTWAPYRRFSTGLEISDREVESPWPLIHPGNMLEPSYESLKAQMREVANNFESHLDKAITQAPEIHEQYDWTRLTENAFDHVIKKFVTV